ncbi:hypothetical protein GOODEAATRI_002270, partial [Goodea atripinnis]
CGGGMTDLGGSFSSPNHPGSYPPNSHCIWVIQVPPPHLVQIRVSSLAVEGPSPCLFDWLEVQEQVEQTSVFTRMWWSEVWALWLHGKSKSPQALSSPTVPSVELKPLICLDDRFCGTTFPPDLTSSGPHMTVVFVADEGVADSGFKATYQAVSVLNNGADEQGCGNSTYPPFSESMLSLTSIKKPAGFFSSTDTKNYNLTSFPNIWLSISDQREAATLLQQYRVRVTSITLILFDTGYNQTVMIRFFSVLRAGANGAGMLRASTEAGVRDVSSSVQPSGWHPPALPLSLLLC